MEPDILQAHALCIQAEITWFRELLEQRLLLHAEEKSDRDLLADMPPPALSASNSPYSETVRQFGMGPAERLMLILSFIPHIKPGILDPFFIQNQSVQRRFTEFGGMLGMAHGGFLPTAETAMFLLAGDNVQIRLKYQYLIHHEHYLYSHHILLLDHRHQEEPLLSAALRMSPAYLERLTTGRTYHPPLSQEFPAQRITTPYDWKDLVLEYGTRQEIDDIVAWVKHEHTLMNEWQLKDRLKAGFRSLFYGPPGTGKTLTASLLGKTTGLPVYRVDLSKVVSKYIGETEKNLASLFDHAQHQNWILFFDEADSLFGKRTESRNANDRAANQQISYLLQRIEDFPGIAILATNMRSHLDEAFARRFQSVVHFPMPGYQQRLRLWEDNFKNKPYSLASDVDFSKLSREYEISGGSIINVLRYACLKAVVRTPPVIYFQDLLSGISRELYKEGKALQHQH